jgi:hypothetical protein
MASQAHEFVGCGILHTRAVTMIDFAMPSQFYWIVVLLLGMELLTFVSDYSINCL